MSPRAIPIGRHAQTTARLLRERLGLDENRFMLTFQSRFGPAEWLQPYTDETVQALAQRGVKNLAVVTPGFAADCLETLEEIAGRERRDLPPAWRREFRRHPVPQRQRGRHAGDRPPGRARAQRLDLNQITELARTSWPTCMICPPTSCRRPMRPGGFLRSRRRAPRSAASRRGRARSTPCTWSMARARSRRPRRPRGAGVPARR